MLESKDVLVIGLGRFGASVVNRLIELNQRVTVVDIDEKRVAKYASIAEYAKVCDTRDEKVLAQLGVNNFDHVVVAIGSSVEASIITTLLLKDMGIENITVKASNSLHRAAIEKLGVSKSNIIMPEAELGQKIAQTIAVPIVADYVDLLGEKFSIIEMYPKLTSLTGKTFRESDVKQKHNVMICAIRRNDEVIIPDGETRILEEDSLIVIGEKEALAKFEQEI